jgi:hypothetical protein
MNKKIIYKSFLLIIFCKSFSLNAQCEFSFRELVNFLKCSDYSFNNSVSSKGYIFDKNNSVFICKDSDNKGHLIEKYIKDDVYVIGYLFPNSSILVNRILNEAKSLGLKLTDSTNNPSTGITTYIYTGWNQIMLQVSGNSEAYRITLYDL